MKKFLIALLGVLCVFIVSGCDNTIEPQTKEEQLSVEFIEISTNTMDKIYVHKETRVMYLWVQEGYGGGLTVMLDENGKPLLWEGEIE